MGRASWPGKFPSASRREIRSAAARVGEKLGAEMISRGARELLNER